MLDQDWNTVTIQKKKTIGTSASAIAQAKSAGVITTERKYGAGSNTASSAGGINVRKIEESEELKHATVDKSLSKAITQARIAKKMTQQQLATAINEKVQIIQEYESGKAIPNPQIINKLDRALGIHLPRGKK